MSKDIFVLASNNSHKMKEMSRILGNYGINLISQAEAGFFAEVEETGVTFEENAYLKASAVTKATGYPAIADDSGLEVEALGGEPGVYTARYGSPACVTDEDRYRFLLHNMVNVENRRAKFVSCITCTFPDGNTITARGECGGEIITEPRGSGGFGYDPVFLYPEAGQTFGEMSDDDKDRVSHRARAMLLFNEKLRGFYADK